MVKSILSATIFVSSPADVQPERESVRTTVAQWNSRNAEARGVTFKVWAWEDNSVPDLGADAQDAMNAQIPSDYDILVGIFWSRLGTPTNRSGSGTQEEIEDAIRRRNETKTPHVAIYFKKDNFPIDKIDLDQLEKLRDFEAHLKGRALVGQFNEIQSFEAQIERLLDKKADEYRGATPQKPSPPEQIDRTSDSYARGNPYEDYGLFDLVEEGVELLDKSRRTIVEITDRMSQFEANITEITARLRSAQQYGDVSIKRTRPIVREAASEMNELSRFIDERIDTFSQSFETATEFAVRIIDISDDFDDEGGAIDEYKRSLEDLRSGGEKAIESQESLRQTILSLPRIDTQTNLAKRRLSGAIERLTDVMRAGLDRLNDG